MNAGLDMVQGAYARRNLAGLPVRFGVPEKVRELGIESFPLSVRLGNVLSRRGIVRLGDLHNLSVEELMGSGNCGVKTVMELHRILEQAEAGEFNSLSSSFIVPATLPTVQPTSFCVVEPIRLQNVFELPLSVRLEHVLRSAGIVHLGQLHGMQFQQLRRVRNCGRVTIAELRLLIGRTAIGEFNVPPDLAEGEPGALIRLLDTLVAQLPERKRFVLCLRLGAENGTKETLDSIASRFNVTRERVRQSVLVVLMQIQKSGSIPLRTRLERLEARCQEAGVELSPEILGQWLGVTPAPRQFSLPFYVRLIGRLRTGLRQRKPGRVSQS